MVIGKKGSVLKDVGTAVRRELQQRRGAGQVGESGDRIYLELQVKVERDWQRREEALDKLLDVQEPDSGPAEELD